MDQNQTTQGTNSTQPIQSPTPQPEASKTPIENPIKPASKFSVKAIIGIIIFLILAGGAAASFTVFRPQIMSLVSKPTPTPTVIPGLTRNPVSPTPDATANWKTYKIEGLSFKYPLDMEVFPCGMKGVDQILSVGIKKTGDNTTYCGIGGLPAIFTIGTNDEIMTIEEFLSKRTLNSTQTISPIQYKTINSFKIGFTTLSTEGGFSTQTHAFIDPSDDKLYYIISNSDWKNNESLLNQILSTLKFTDAQTVDTSSWKTYTNSAVGFEIKFPNKYPSPPSLPGGPGENIKATGTETDNHILFGTSSTDTFGIQVFPYIGSLNSLITTDKAKSIPPYDWEGKTTTVSSQQIKVALQNSLLITSNYKNSTELPFKAVFFVGKGYGFILNFSRNYTDNQITQILSTFRFD
ncbi:MAG: hypothetical protein Q7T54_05980 [Candidatus Levybacteria bacterium]|nr:hypothetical protein [Candidatus Levybacteria bacterium]